MLNQMIQALQNGMNEGIHEINDGIDDAVYGNPEEMADAEAMYDAQKEADKENSYIDKVNAKIDAKIDTKAEKVRNKVNEFNQSFDQGVVKAKEKIKEVSRSDFMQIYRAARMARWGSLAVNYMKTNPDWLNNVKDFGNDMTTKLKRLGMENTAEESLSQTETESICARRDLLFGSPNAGISQEITTEAILAGADVPMSGLESMMLEAAM